MRSAPPVPPGQQSDGRTRVLSQNLLALGLTSFFTDISSEMVVAVVPLFLTAGLGFSIVGFGLFEAAYQATNAVFRIWGGTIADHRQSHKKTAATGYSISTATRFGLVASSLIAWLPAVPFLLADRIGKGIRTAPRDALISLSTAPNRLAMAFGIHRAMDTAGALLGPLAAYAILEFAPGEFDAVFVISAIFGVIGAAIIWLFAQEKPQPTAPPVERRRVREQWREVLSTPGVRPLAIAVALLSVMTVGDAFIYLVILRTTDLNPAFFPLLYVGTALTYLALAVPFGRLADRIGAKPVFLAGNALLVVVYLLLGFTSLGLAVSIICLALLGAYYAATDGVIPAIVSRLVGGHIRASGIAFVTVVVALARMVSAGLFGLLWETLGKTTALTVYLVGLGAALVLATWLLSSNTESSATPQTSDAASS